MDDLIKKIANSIPEAEVSAAQANAQIVSEHSYGHLVMIAFDQMN